MYVYLKQFQLFFGETLVVVVSVLFIKIRFLAEISDF